MASALNVLMATTPETLASRQYDCLHAATIARLEEVIMLLKKHDLKEISDNLLQHSPAGDGYGEENDYIKFENGTKIDADLGEILELLSDRAKVAGLKGVTLIK